MKLLVDMDDCILDFESTWKNKLIQHFPELKFNFPPRKSFYIYHDLPNEYHEVAKTIADVPGLFEEFEPYENAIEALNHLDSLYEVELVTAPHTSNLYCYSEKAVWINTHFGKKWLDKLTITKDKKQVIGDFLIDDHPNVVGRNVVPTWKQIVFHQSYNSNVECVYRLFSWNDIDFNQLLDFLKNKNNEKTIKKVIINQ